MKKLLHEWLRELENWCQLYERYSIKAVSLEKLMNAFADEIERYYIPRPRFEDGEPVQFGDEVFSSANETVNKPDEQYTVEGMRFYKGFVRFDNSMSQTRNFIPVSDGEFVKRPTPKILDADGVPCERGDEVWDLKGIYDVPLTVLEPDDDGSVKVTIPDGKGYTGFHADLLTHERPVFDANGERICKGDTVWHVPDSKKLTVQEVDAEKGYVWCGEILDGTRVAYNAKFLTHREPDSLKKLRDDMREAMATSPDAMFMDSRWVDRLTALIERGA